MQKQLIVHPLVGLGEIKFGMSPKRYFLHIKSRMPEKNLAKNRRFGLECVCLTQAKVRCFFDKTDAFYVCRH